MPTNEQYEEQARRQLICATIAFDMRDPGPGHANVIFEVKDGDPDVDFVEVIVRKEDAEAIALPKQDSRPEYNAKMGKPQVYCDGFADGMEYAHSITPKQEHCDGEGCSICHDRYLGAREIGYKEGKDVGYGDGKASLQTWDVKALANFITENRSFSYARKRRIRRYLDMRRMK